MSDIIPIPSVFDHYKALFQLRHDKNDGTVRIFARTSHNGKNWTDWQDITNGVPYKMFNNGSFSMEKSVFQYKIELDLGTAINKESPTVDFIKFDLIGTYNIINTGDKDCLPEIWLKKINGSGDIRLTNETTGQTMEFVGLNNGETVYIDCENEDIVTDLPMTYRYDSHNDVFLNLKVGDNLLSGEGEFIMSLKLEFKTLQG